LTAFSTFEEVYTAYSRQVEYFSHQMVYHINRGELAQREGGPLPCLSVLTDDCIARGRDITDGGAVYNYHSICFIGTATTADALMAIKKLIYEEKSVSPAELLEALRSNWEGREPLRQKMLKRAPKYGNDLPEVDGLAARVAGDFIRLMDQMRSPLNGRYFVHLFSFVWHLDFGRTIGATPDGRKAHEPLAYSLAAQQGRDERGITALLSSISRLPHRQAAGATAAIVEIDPVLVSGEDGALLMSQLIMSAMKMGVGQLQWNVVTAERLLKAQADPERYGNIPVRVAGYSQMFRLVDKQLQDHIIARTKHCK
jgi:formate C-acetyltransferase